MNQSIAFLPLWRGLLLAAAIIFGGGAFLLKSQPQIKLDDESKKLEAANRGAASNEFPIFPQRTRVSPPLSPISEISNVQRSDSIIPPKKKRLADHEIDLIMAQELHLDEQRAELIAATNTEGFTSDERQEALRLWAEQTYLERRNLKRAQNEIFLQENFPNRYESKLAENPPAESK